MTDLLQSLDPAQFSAFKSGDDAALTALFRTHYDALLTLARSALGPDLEHFSGRVAVQATMDTWQQRATISTAAGLSASWEDAIREEAAQQKRRHASLHQRDGSATLSHIQVPTVDEAVAQLNAAMHPPEIDHEKVMADAVSARRHHAAGQLKSVAGGGGRGWKGPALVLGALVVVIIFGMRWLSSTGGEAKIKSALASEDARHLASARGQRGNVTLADSSIAQIGSDSRLTLPLEFGVTMRTLRLEGSAAFTVSKGSEMPFSVRALNSIITATGTRFAVRAYEDDSLVFVGVDDGTVTVQAVGDKQTTTVSAGEGIRMTPDGTITPLDATARAVALGWETDTLVFVDTPVKVVLSELGRWFDLKAKLADPALGERLMSARIHLGSSGDALTEMTNAANLSIGFDKDDKVVLSDKPAAPVKPGAKKK